MKRQHIDQLKTIHRLTTPTAAPGPPPPRPLIKIKSVAYGRTRRWKMEIPHLGYVGLFATWAQVRWAVRHLLKK